MSNVVVDFPVRAGNADEARFGRRACEKFDIAHDRAAFFARPLGNRMRRRVAVRDAGAEDEERDPFPRVLSEIADTNAFLRRKVAPFRSSSQAMT